MGSDVHARPCVLRCLHCLTRTVVFSTVASPSRFATAKQLEILYQYNGKQHWCTIEQDQDILLPIKEHELADDEIEALRNAPEERKKKQRRKKLARGARRLWIEFFSFHFSLA